MIFLQLSHRPEGGKAASYSYFVMVTLLMVMGSVGRWASSTPVRAMVILDDYIQWRKEHPGEV